MKKIFICCLFVAMILTLTACDEYSANLMPEYPTETELLADESDLTPNFCIDEFLQEIDIDFMEQRAGEIERIVVVTLPYLRRMELSAEERMQPRTFYITERSEIEYVYNILNETRAIYINEHPYHWQAWMEGMEVFLFIEYANGEVSEIQSYDIGHNIIGRFLDTVGDHNDPGYILGINERIWEFIDNLSND